MLLGEGGPRGPKAGYHNPGSSGIGFVFFNIFFSRPRAKGSNCKIKVDVVAISMTLPLQH